MLDETQPARWHSGRYVLGSLLLAAACWWTLRHVSVTVDQATRGLSLDRCAGVPWLQVVGECEGLVLLQLADSRDEAQKIVTAIRARSAGKALVSVKLDYLFILSYVAFLGLLGAAVAGTQRVRGIPWLRRLLLLLVLLQGVAGLLDGIENVGLFTMLNRGNIEPDIPRWTSWAAVMKWRLIGAGLALPVLAFLFTLAWERYRGKDESPQRAPIPGERALARRR